MKGAIIAALALLIPVLLILVFYQLAGAESTDFAYPTQPSSAFTKSNFSYVNVSIGTTNNTSSFIDWNRSLVGYWSFDYYNSSGVFDNSTWNNFGSFIGNVTSENITTGVYGNGLKLNGSVACVQKTFSQNFNFSRTNQITVEGWLKINSGSELNNAIAGRWEWFRLVPRTSGVYFGVWNNTNHETAIETSDQINTDSWHYFVGVMNGTHLLFYRDGLLNETLAFNGRIADVSGSMSIGSQNCLVYNTNGTIDEVKIWNRALSQEEINASYNSGIYRLYRNFTNLTDGTYSYYAYSIDQAGNANKTETRYLTVDTSAPKYSQNQTNNTVAAQPTLFSLNWTDATSSLSGYIFSTNNSGSWINATWELMTGGQNQSAATVILNSTASWMFYANDSSGNWNSSEVYSVVASQPEPVPETITGSGSACMHSVVIETVKPIESIAGDSKTAEITLRNLGCYDEFVSVSLSCPESWSCGSASMPLVSGASAKAYLTISVPIGVKSINYVVPVTASYEYQTRGELMVSVNPMCRMDIDCNQNEICVDSRCVRLFDVEILRADSPVKPGSFLDFSYLMKSMSSKSGDVRIDFWLESLGRKVLSGYETVHLAGHETKTQTASIYTPENATLGIYELYVQVSQEGYKTSSKAPVEIANETQAVLDMSVPSEPTQTLDGINMSFGLNFNVDETVLVRLDEVIVRNNETVWRRSRDVYVKGSAVISETVGLLEAGDYEMIVTATYADKTVVSTRSFSIEAASKAEENSEERDISLLPLAAAVALAALIVAIRFRPKTKKTRKH